MAVTTRPTVGSRPLWFAVLVVSRRWTRLTLVRRPQRRLADRRLRARGAVRAGLALLISRGRIPLRSAGLGLAAGYACLSGDERPGLRGRISRATGRLDRRPERCRLLAGHLPRLGGAVASAADIRPGSRWRSVSSRPWWHLVAHGSRRGRHHRVVDRRSPAPWAVGSASSRWSSPPGRSRTSRPPTSPGARSPSAPVRTTSVQRLILLEQAKLAVGAVLRRRAGLGVGLPRRPAVLSAPATSVHRSEGWCPPPGGRLSA